MKKWEAPKLIVLVRGTPEEVVLQACKGYDSGFLSSLTMAGGSGCSFIEVPSLCTTCNVYTMS